MNSPGVTSTPGLVAQAQHELEMLALVRVGADGHDRLVKQLESAFVAGARQLRDPVHFAMPLRHVVRLVQLHAVAALILGRVAGDVGGAHHVGDGRGLAGDLDDADADADREARRPAR